jgi:hypothetical protein
VQFKRFTKNNFFIEKNPTLVTFPVKNLDLKDALPVPTGELVWPFGGRNEAGGGVSCVYVCVGNLDVKEALLGERERLPNGESVLHVVEE